MEKFEFEAGTLVIKSHPGWNHLFQITFTPEAARSKPEVLKLLRFAQNLWETTYSNTQVLLLFDASHVVDVPLKLAKPLGLFLREQEKKQETAQYLRASALIIPQGLLRKLLDLILAFHHPSIPFAIWESKNEASSFLANYLVI